MVVTFIPCSRLRRERYSMNTGTWLGTSGASFSGILTLICQTPTRPGARPEYSTFSAAT